MEANLSTTEAFGSDMTDECRGGVIATEKGVLNISNSQFENNSAESGGDMTNRSRGGVIVAEKSVLNISNSQFEK